MQVTRFIFLNNQWRKRIKAISCILILIGKDLQLIQKAVIDLLFYQYLILKRLIIFCIIIFELIIPTLPKYIYISPFHFQKSKINPFIYIPILKSQKISYNKRKNCTNCQ